MTHSLIYLKRGGEKLRKFYDVQWQIIRWLAYGEITAIYSVNIAKKNGSE